VLNDKRGIELILHKCWSLGSRLVTIVFITAWLLPASSNNDALRLEATSADDPAATPAPASCPAGAPIGAIDLRVKSVKDPDTLPFQTINHLSEDDTVVYSPILRNREKRPGEISLVMVPAKRQPKGPSLLVTDPKPAEKPQKWTIPRTVSLA